MAACHTVEKRAAATWYAEQGELQIAASEGWMGALPQPQLLGL